MESSKKLTVENGCSNIGTIGIRDWEERNDCQNGPCRTTSFIYICEEFWSISCTRVTSLDIRDWKPGNNRSRSYLVQPTRVAFGCQRTRRTCPKNELRQQNTVHLLSGTPLTIDNTEIVIVALIRWGRPGTFALS